MERYLASEFADNTRGKNAREIRLAEFTGEPRNKDVEGRTQWKHGRPVRYTRATYYLEVNIPWLWRRFPLAMVGAVFTDGTIELVTQDLSPQRYGACAGESLDAQEDELLYAE